jgi:hypothetical protein
LALAACSEGNAIKKFFIPWIFSDAFLNLEGIITLWPLDGIVLFSPASEKKLLCANKENVMNRKVNKVSVNFLIQIILVSIMLDKSKTRSFLLPPGKMEINVGLFVQLRTNMVRIAIKEEGLKEPAINVRLQVSESTVFLSLFQNLSFPLKNTNPAGIMTILSKSGLLFTS